MNPPLVSIVIATRNRAEDLEYTLLRLRQQTYDAVELIVVDDASEQSLEPVVRKHWPNARFTRKATNVGQCQCRTEAISESRGKYVLQLDDDACPTRENDLALAIDLMEQRPYIGLLTFAVFNGRDLPADLPPVGPARFMASFMAGASLLRRDVFCKVGGYRPFFGNEWEEEELSMRLIGSGSAVLFTPNILIHHRVSEHNRRTSRTWMRGFRNKLWALTMNAPPGPLVIETCWTLMLAVWDSMRLLRPHRLLHGLAEFALGFRKVLALRKPLSNEAYRRYIAVRLKTVEDYQQFAAPAPMDFRDVLRWFERWRRRPRQRSVWDRSSGGIGSCDTHRYEHEFRN